MAHGLVHTDNNNHLDGSMDKYKSINIAVINNDHNFIDQRPIDQPLYAHCSLDSLNERGEEENNCQSAI